MAKKKNTADDIRAKSADELGEHLTKLKKEQFNLRFQAANGQLENTGRVRVVRREIARIETIMTQQHAAAAASAGKKE
ncbi:MAG TPA: 50S ribosomal protein L29 [Rhizomicrobium sp.]|jgi:large subunit ribosomal protein L29|nr:50S ribosomal protein L29 [Rhizomicrobium sp.]